MGEDVFPFVVGCAKSGTTMLRAMLDSHPALAIPPESYFVARLAKRPRSGWSVARGEALGRSLAGDRWIRRWGLSEQDMVTVLTSGAIEGPSDAVRALYALYARARGKPRYGDKTPGYVFGMPDIARLLPESRFVHLVRDGRDVALSLRGQRFAPDDAGGAALFWRQRVVSGRRAGRELGPERYLEVRYEDLVSDPDGAMQPICRFLGMDFHPAMLRYHERSGEVLAGVMRKKGHANIARPPVRGLRDWRSQMSRGDVQLVEALTGDLLGDLGYEVSSSAAPARVRLKAVRLRVAHGLRSLSGSAREAISA